MSDKKPPDSLALFDHQLLELNGRYGGELAPQRTFSLVLAALGVMDMHKAEHCSGATVTEDEFAEFARMVHRKIRRACARGAN